MQGVQTEVIFDLKNSLLPRVHENFRPLFEYALLDESAGRLRPALVRATAEAFRSGGKVIGHLSRGVELVHGASLIVDDSPAQDNSSLRRGRPAFHVKFGPGKTINTSVAMLANAFYQFSMIDAERGLNGDLVQYAARRIGDYGMCLGQDMDLDTFGKGHEPETVEDLDETAYRKTGSAFEIAVGGIAVVHRSGREVMKALHEYSRYLGIAFQIKDDLLDGVEGPKGLGKTPDLDARNGKANYVSLLGEAAATEHFRNNSALAVQAVGSLSDRMDVNRLREIVTYVGRKVPD
jgi:farnesyl diphosphate synthase